MNPAFLKPLPDRLKSPGLALGLVLLLGLGLRLWHLDLKPLWLDEVLTALFTMGRSYQDVPLNQWFPLTALNGLFTVQSGLSCDDITRRITTESVHPPVFFCLLYTWMSWLQPTNWVWGLRILPALFGVATIAAMAWLNRAAFSAQAGLRAAALMAVSPFAVYLSQEARHYTLPMLLVTLALVALVKMQQDVIGQKRLRATVWTSWTLLNLVGLYTHYFCILALMAQIGAFTLWMAFRRTIQPRFWVAWSIAIVGVTVGYLPWMPTLISHFNRPETDWLIPYKPDWLDRLEPLYQTLAGWTLMVIALPVENQPTSMAIGLGLLTLGFMLWLVWQVRQGARRLWRQPTKRPALLLLLGFTGCVLLQFFAIVYLLNKDLTVVPRYNFIYYPGVCALLAACLGNDSARPSRPRHPIGPVLLVGLISSLFVVHGWVFQKSYQPDQVARNMRFEPDRPLAVVMTYRSPQEVALGLSFALALQQTAPTVDEPVRFAFLDRSQGARQAWNTLSDLPQPLLPPLNLWIVGSPGMRTGDYPQRLTLNAPATPRTRPRMRCEPDPEKLYRRGFPYQLFRCNPLPRRAE